MKSQTSKCSPFQGARRCWQGWRGPSNLAVSRTHGPRMHLAMIFILLSCLVSFSTAAIALDSPRRPYSAETLLVDTRIPVFAGGHWQIMSEDEHRRHLRKRVARRAESDNEGVTSTVNIQVPSSTSAPASPLPSPFDGALAANFSGDNNGACPNFINQFLSDPTFKRCYPFSLLLQGSHSFFEAEKSLVSITQVLEATCAADVDSCTDFLDNLATELVSDDHCAEDYAQQNSVVVQAYMGMRAYRTVYEAACLTDPDTSAFCYANAITNLTTTANVYLYFLPLNSTYPARAEPTCGWCTSATMGVYQNATADRASSIARTYESAADRVNEVCGSDFVNTTLAAAIEENAGSTSQPPGPLFLVLLLVISISHWLL